jgi:hypothetical protein
MAKESGEDQRQLFTHRFGLVRGLDDGSDAMERYGSVDGDENGKQRGQSKKAPPQ